MGKKKFLRKKSGTSGPPKKQHAKKEPATYVPTQPKIIQQLVKEQKSVRDMVEKQIMLAPQLRQMDQEDSDRRQRALIDEILKDQKLQQTMTEARHAEANAARERQFMDTLHVVIDKILTQNSAVLRLAMSEARATSAEPRARSTTRRESSPSPIRLGVGPIRTADPLRFIIQNPRDPRSPKSKKEVQLCKQCKDFACVMQWQEEEVEVIKLLPEEILLQWLLNHGACHSEICDACGTEAAKQVEPTVCPCRKVLYGTKPWKYCRSKLHPMYFLLIIVAMANAQHYKGKLNKNTVSAMTHYMCRVCVKYEGLRVVEWRTIQVDESDVGERKDHRGKRVREDRFWLMVAVNTVYDPTPRRE